ncbi:MAG: AI-2E family transporter [Bacillus sp. (in: firmicutes)]
MADFVSFLRSKAFSRIMTLLVIVLFLYSIGSMVNLVLFTFIFAFLMGRLQTFICSQLNKLVKVNPKFILLILYIVVVTLLANVLYKYLPVITLQITDLITEIHRFLQHPPKDEVILFLVNTVKDLPLDLQSNINRIYAYASEVGKVSFQVILGIILSLFLLLEREKIIAFTSRFKKGNFSSFFINVEHFGKKFMNSFGKVIEVQFLIATTNAVISVIGLWLLGFPQLIGLGIMIFFLGLIPVAGVIISLIPLSMIAYNIGGITTVIAVLILIAVVHALEAYILNPKFMSVKTNLPTFFTLAILLFAEHFLGIWGLIIGIPVFIFIMDMLEVPEENALKEDK